MVPIKPKALRMTSRIGKIDLLKALKREKALTLIELLVVLAILAAVILMALPHFKTSYRNLEINSFLSNLEKNIRYIQYRSIMEGKRFQLRYDNSEKSYRFLYEERERNKTNWVPLEGRWGRPNKIPTNMDLWFRGKEKIFFLPNGNVTEGDMTLREDSEILATIHLGRSLRGAEIERKNF